MRSQNSEKLLKLSWKSTGNEHGWFSVWRWTEWVLKALGLVWRSYDVNTIGVSSLCCSDGRKWKYRTSGNVSVCIAKAGWCTRWWAPCFSVLRTLLHVNVNFLLKISTLCSVNPMFKTKRPTYISHITEWMVQKNPRGVGSVCRTKAAQGAWRDTQIWDFNVLHDHCFLSCVLYPCG